MVVLPKAEIKAIAKLLKSDDEDTFKLLEEQLKTFDIQLLRKIRDEISLDDVELHKKFFDFAIKLRRDRLKDDFSHWSKSYSDDLERGVFLVANFANPFLDEDYYSKLLHNWSEKISGNLNKLKIKNDPTSVINEVNHFLFMEVGFKGNKEKYYDPSNSFINEVIDKKLGNPILLSTVYLLLANRLDLPFTGVNMPTHFLVKYEDGFGPIFIDPFNSGEIITPSVCQERIKVLRLEWHDEYLSAPTNKQIIARMLQNLVNIYHNDEKFQLKEYVEDYAKVVKRSLSQ